MTERARRIEPVSLEFRDERTPWSPRFDDVYFSASSGIEESRYVYLEGSGFADHLPSAQSNTIVAEIGFGTGLNFLLTLSEWRRKAVPGSRLIYISFEKHPVVKEDLERLYSSYPELEKESRELLSRYPILVPGVHPLRFPGGVELHLALGEAGNLLRNLDFEADFWYWDGFSPKQNPDAFSEALFHSVARNSKAGARGATFTSAGWVRRGLEGAGFSLKKRKGFGKKRECVSGVLSSPPPSIHESDPWFSRKKLKILGPGARIAILGAGLSGSAIARALAERGFEVSVFDPNGAGTRTSGNPIGLFNVQLSKVPNPVSRFAQLSLACLLREVEELQLPNHRGILRTDLQDADALRANEYPKDFFIPVREGMEFPFCGVLSPPALCRARLNHPGIRLHLLGVHAVEPTSKGPILRFESGECSDPFDHVIYALGAEAKISSTPFQNRIHDFLPIRPIRGQILLARPDACSSTLSSTLVEEGYATPSLPALSPGGHHLIGATYQAKGVAENQEAIDQNTLIEHARKWAAFQDLSPGQIEGVRVGYRASTPDKLPLIGPLCDPAFLEENYRSTLRGARGLPLSPLEVTPGEWIFSGMGSRGITYSSLGAEVLASLMTGTPLPLESDLLPHLHPSRFFIRNLRKPGLK